MSTATISKPTELWGKAFGAGFHDASVRRNLKPEEYARLPGGPDTANRWTYSQLSEAKVDDATVRQLRSRRDWSRAGALAVGALVATGVAGTVVAATYGAKAIPYVLLAALSLGALAAADFAHQRVGAWVSRFALRGGPIQARYQPGDQSLSQDCRACDCEKSRPAA